MRIGYHFRGYLGDIKINSFGEEVSTPDGNATYSWSIEHECNRRGYKLYPLGKNLDAYGASAYGAELFASFSKHYRVLSYERMLRQGWTRFTDKTFPELDLVILEWRWPIPGRNTPEDRSKPGYQDDLERQWDIIEHYGNKQVPLIIWDLDHKFTEKDYLQLKNDFNNVHVIETSVKPKSWATRVEPPIVYSSLLESDIDERLPKYSLGYIGSRYERDEIIDKWIKPIIKPNSHFIKFWGKWEPRQEVEERWPGIIFGERIGVKGFKDAYSRTAMVPLLAKQSYFDSGFVTPRIWEAIIFGSVPIGISDHFGIEQYCEYVAKTPEDLLEISKWARNLSPLRRRVLREDAAHRLLHMDVKKFIDTIEGLVGATAADKTDVVVEQTD